MKKMVSLLMRIVVVILVIRGFVALLRRRKEVRSKVVDFNKNVLNPLVLRLAGRKQSPYAVLHHVGRRSGRTYITPIVAERSGESFVIALPYGTDVDWYRNIRTAGRCTLTWQGQDYALVEPELIDAITAEPLLFPVVALALRLFGVKQYVRMKSLAKVPEKVAFA